MNCFNHQDVPAVCSCGTCAKGLCQNCMQPCSGKFVCSNPCDENWEKLAKMNERALKIYGLDKPGSKSRTTGSRFAMFYISAGLPFLAYGIYDLFFNTWQWQSGALFSVLGLVFTVFGYKTYKDGIKL